MPRLHLAGASAVSPAQNARDNGLVGPTGPRDDLGPLGLVHVLGTATDERLICFGRPAALEERTRLHGEADAVKHEPSRLLRDAQVLRQLSAGNALLVRSDKPNRQHPRPQRDLAVLKNGADLYRKPLTTVTAFVGAVVTEMINAGRFAMGAKCTILPPDRCEMINCRLLVGQRGHHLKDGVEGLLFRAHTLL